MVQLGQALEEMDAEKRANARKKMATELAKRDVLRRNMLEEINALRSLKINNGLANNIRGLVDRASREAERMHKIKVPPAVDGVQRMATSFMDNLARNMKATYNSVVEQNVAIDREIKMREMEVQKMNIKVQEAQKVMSTMKGNFDPKAASRLVQEIKDTFSR